METRISASQSMEAVKAGIELLSGEMTAQRTMQLMSEFVMLRAILTSIVIGKLVIGVPAPLPDATSGDKSIQ